MKLEEWQNFTGPSTRLLGVDVTTEVGGETGEKLGFDTDTEKPSTTKGTKLHEGIIGWGLSIRLRGLG
jgi:hypothetical protein